MTSIGAYKSHRTRVITGMETENREAPALMAQRPNIPRATAAQAHDLQARATDLIAQLQAAYDKMEAYNQKIEDEYLNVEDEPGLREFHVLLTTDAPRIRQVEKSITSLTNFKFEAAQRLVEIARLENPAEVQQPQEAADTKVMAQAVLRLTEELQHARANVNPAAAVVPAGGRGNANVQAVLDVKLPKLEMTKFSGDVLKWTAFWQQFDSAINKNAKLAPVSKFNYLLGLLEGKAKETVQGFHVTPDNYTAAIALLAERFGRTDIIIDSHLSTLFDLAPIQGNTLSELRAFYEIVETNVRQLASLGQDLTQNIAIIKLIKSKLPIDVLKEMEIQKGRVEPWTMTNLRTLFKESLELREKLDHTRISEPSQVSPQSTSKFSTQVSPQVTQFSKFSKPPKATGEALIVHDQPRRYNKPTFSKTCIYCEKPHYADECRSYPSLADRKARIKGKCFLCLKQGHIVPNCTANTTCYHCQAKGNHHRSLCPQKFASAKPSDKPSKGLGKSPTDTQQQVMCVDEKSEVKLLAPGKKVYMQTAQVTVANPKNLAIQEQVRAFLDTGCQTTCITSRLAKKMGLKVGPSVQKTFVRYGSDEIETKMVSYADITVILDDTDEKTLTVEVTDKITGKNQRLPVSFEVMKEIRHIKLSDTCPKEVETYTIEFLIGLDYYMDFLIPKILGIKGQSHLFLQASSFGYLLSGRTEDVAYTGYAGEPHMLVVNEGYTHIDTALFSHSDPSTQFEPSMDDFMDLETVGIKSSKENADDLIALSKFHDTVQVIDGRLVVGWPWKDEVPEERCLPTNYNLAYHRFKSVALRLQKDEGLLKTYDDIIQEQVRRGIVEKVTDTTEEGTLKHYIPHHPVVTPLNTTTKVRVVLDASARAKKGNKSLNDCLYRGPVGLQELVGLLIRFLGYPIGLMADIEKAFLQISLLVSDRDVVRFLWFKDPTNPVLEGNLQIYRFRRVPFGVVSSPFLLAESLRYFLTSYGTKVATQINGDIYVDNVITGTDDVESAVQLYNESQEIFKQVSMNLREWTSNSQLFLDNIPEVHRAVGKMFKILGLKWNIETDTISLAGLKKEKFNKQISTKRQALQALQSVYDPLGFFAPVKLKAILFIHGLWESKFDWDDKFPPDKVLEWNEIFEQLKEISEYPIPRFIGNFSDTSTKFQLLCFCDASASSYATVVYIQQVLDGVVKVNIILSKLRLTPKNQLSIPRAELQAGVIGKRSLDYVETQLRIPISAKHLWTDSKCLLSWLQSTKRLSVFVQNRVDEILASNDIQFHYVHTSSNPADFATRGKSVAELHDSMWWNGPDWLTRPESAWETWDTSTLDQETLDKVAAEVKGPKVMFSAGLFVGEGPTVQPKEMVTPFDIKHDRYSSLNRLLRITALCMRFIKKLQRKQPPNEQGKVKFVTAGELKEAKLLWDKCIQKHCFSEELSAITSGKKNSRCDQLDLHCDENGLIRSYARFQNAELTESARQPKILPKDDYFTQLVIEDFHRDNFHAGVSHTLAATRSEYWILQGRSKVGSVLKKCTKCRKVIGGPYKVPKMAPWPKLRTSKCSPFTYTGVDYFGPLYVKEINQPVTKKWVSLFTCATVRAVHLELVDDMTTEHFLMAMRRFIARFGKPDLIISDNAPQFKLSDTVLANVWSDIIHDPEIQSYVSDKGIEWKFIVEFAPWMGGFYERMVGLVKMALKKTLPKVTLSSVQLCTLLAEIQSVVNSRPLTYTGEDVKSNMSLSPAHFLTMNPKIGFPEIADEFDTDNDPNYQEGTRQNSGQRLQELWKKGQKHLDRFWDHFEKEYLPSLRETMKTNIQQGRVKSSEFPKVGDVVHIKEDKQPRGTWKLGRISKLLPSQDGEIRTAEIQLPTKRFLKRRINLLYPLQCSTEVEPTDEGNKLPPNDMDKQGILGILDTEKKEEVKQKPTRQAAMKARRDIQSLADQNLI